MGHPAIVARLQTPCYSKLMQKTHDRTIAVRLPAKTLRAINQSRRNTETTSQVVRRLLDVALILLAKDEPRSSLAR